MIKIIRLKYEDKGPWYSSHKKLKELLSDARTEELFIEYLDENGKMTCDLLTDLQGKKVLVNNEIIRIPTWKDLLRNFQKTKAR
ncbi:MAG: hypothetical protein EHM47_16570 [Ignavibacteriales bacterium]|nr:MAG: hypothetical protein EHM47_16570 [Ignavibacteriales bacterium]